MKKVLLLCLLLVATFTGHSQQLKPENPLKALAEHNLQELNTFAKPDDAGKAWGKLFQFGRNVAFDYNDTPTPVQERISGNDARLFGREFFMRIDGDGGRFDWLLDGSATDTWQSIVAKAKDAPTSYIGTNQGDPCPEGYHLPTKTEFSAFFPSSFSAADFSGEPGTKMVNEEVMINGQTQTFQAEYLSKTKNIIYGIKYIGGDSTLRTAYRWSWNGSGVSIISRLIGADTNYQSVSDIVKRDFWEYDMADYVKREIPASGMISGYTGMPAQRYDDIYIWSCESGSDKGYAQALWGYPADDEGYSEGGISPYNEAIGRYTAASVRCVRNVQEVPTDAKVTFRPQSGSEEGAGHIEAEYSINGSSPIVITGESSVPLGAKVTLRAIPAKECRVKNLLVNNSYPLIDGDKLAEITDPETRIVTYIKDKIDKDLLFEPFFDKISPIRRLDIRIHGTGKVSVRTNDGDLLTPEGGISVNSIIENYPGTMIALRIDTVPEIPVEKILINGQAPAKEIRIGKWIYDIPLPEDADRIVLEVYFGKQQTNTKISCSSARLDADGKLEQISGGKVRIYKINEHLEEVLYQSQNDTYQIPLSDKFFVGFTPETPEIGIVQWIVNGTVIGGEQSPICTMSISADLIRSALSIEPGKPFDKEIKLVVAYRDFTSATLAETDQTVVYPSETEGTATLRVPTKHIGHTVRVFSAAGVLICRLRLTTNVQAIDFSDYAPGIYYIRVGKETLSILKH